MPGGHLGYSTNSNEIISDFWKILIELFLNTYDY